MSSAPQPSLLFSLNGTTNDSILGIQGVVGGSTPTTQYVTGLYGQAFNFLNVQGSAAVNYITATQSAVTFSNTSGFTMSFWINLSAVMTNTQYWGGLFSGGVLLGHLSITSGGPGTGNGVFFFFDTSGSATNLSRVYVPPLVWNHLAIVINSTTETIYLNGVQASTGTYTFGGTPYLSGFTGPIGIGGYSGSPGLTGYMQDFRMHNTALSTPQILGIYQSQGIPPRLTATSNVAQPSLLFSFNGSNVDSVTNLSPSAQSNAWYTSGLYQQAAVFTNTLISAPTTSTSIVYNTTPTFSSTRGFTISFWFNIPVPLSANSGFFAINNGAGTGSNQVATLLLQSSGTFAFIQPSSTAGSGNAANPSTRYTFTPVPGVWYHVALSVDATNWNQYLQGSLLTSISGAYTAGTVGMTSFSGPLYIGWNNGAQNPPICYIQDFRIYNTALSTPQIFGIYQSQGIPPRLTMVPATGGLPDPLYAWQFNGTAVDSISGIVPTLANVNGVDTTGVYSTWANQLIYDSTAAKYGSAISLRNPNGPTITSNALYFRNTSGIRIPFGDVASSTVTFWVKFLDTRVAGADNTILFLSRDSGSVNYYIANYGTNIGTYGSWQGPAAVGPNVTLSPVNGTWYHISLVITNTRSTMYLNGSAGTPVTYTAVAGGSSNVWNSLALASYDFGGASGRASTSSIEIDDLRIYNTPLTPAQIQTIYNSGGNLYGATTAQPSLLWSFNGSNVDSVTQLSPTTTLGTPTYVSGLYGQAISFTGTIGATPATSNIYYAITPNIPVSSGFSMSVWAYIPALATTITGANVFWALNNGGGNGFRCLYNRNSGGIHQWQMQYYGGSTPTYVVYNGVLANQWYNLTNTMSSSGEHAFYMNGVQIGTYTITGGSSGISGQNIYAATVGSGQQYNQFVGYVQDLRFYNTALSAPQIQGIYLSGGVRPSAVLTSG